MKTEGGSAILKTMQTKRVFLIPGVSAVDVSSSSLCQVKLESRWFMRPQTKRTIPNLWNVLNLDDFEMNSQDHGWTSLNLHIAWWSKIIAFVMASHSRTVVDPRAGNEQAHEKGGVLLWRQTATGGMEPGPEAEWLWGAGKTFLTMALQPQVGGKMSSGLSLNRSKSTDSRARI